LGEGTIPLREIVQGLTEAGYDGFYEVELMGEEIEAIDNCELLAMSRKTFAEWVGSGQRSEVRGQKSDARGQRSEVRV
jgi:hypothetical protein